MWMNGVYIRDMPGKDELALTHGGVPSSIVHLDAGEQDYL